MDKKFLTIRTTKGQTVDTKNSLKKKFEKRTGQTKDMERTKVFLKKIFMTPGGPVQISTRIDSWTATQSHIKKSIIKRKMAIIKFR